MPRDPEDPLIGRVLAGRYRVEALIDRGGMGRVYRAVQEPLGRAVALKTLDLSDPRGEFKQRFLNEAAVQGRLSHPNTVRMFDYGRTDDGLYYITMELLDGESLNAVVRREAPLDPLRVVKIMRQVCMAMHEAHELGVVHRDLKPGNVFLTQHGGQPDHVKILDFGLVKDLEAAQDLSHTGQTLGSPMYMAPEQVEGDPVDRRTDIYALGLLTWVALTGKEPFPKGSIATIMLHQVSTPLPSLASVGVKCPPALEQLVNACAAKDREQRPASMAEVDRRLGLIERELSGNALDDDLSITVPSDPRTRQRSLPPVAAPPRPVPPPSPPAPRRTSSLALALVGFSIVLLAGAAVLALLGIGGGGFALWVTSKAPAPAPSQPEVVEEAYARVVDVLRCSEVVVQAPAKGLLRGRIALTGKPRVSLRGPDDLLGVTSVRGDDQGRVEIEVEAGEPGVPVEFEVVCPGIVALTTDRGQVSVGRVRGEAFRVVTGNGNVTLEGADVKALSVEVSESADVDLGAIAVQTATIDLLGSGDLGAKGTARELRLTQQGSGRATLFDLTAVTAVVDLHGSGDAEVTVTGSLVARSENSGDVRYAGNPKDVDARALGSGQIQPR
ncbi:MAG: protein kinase [Alphaproteobacteria bacterium]|nr:protein kinase [Alphaproteobacteria bacterium]